MFKNIFIFQNKMSSLKNLGIECTYDSIDPEGLHYSVSIKQDRLKSPKQSKKYFREIIDAISKDASKKGGLDHLTLSLDEEIYLGNLKSVVKDLSRKEQKNLELFKKLSYSVKKFSVTGGIIGGGLVGLIFGYEPITEWATNIAERMNEISYLLAPATGLIQAGISILGTLATTLFGSAFGGMFGELISNPCDLLRIQQVWRVERYKSLEQALLQVEHETSHEMS